MSNLSCNSDRAPLDYGYIFKEALFDNLYVRQIDYWNKRLQNASEKNVACYSREDPSFNNDNHSFVSLFYDGEVFNLLPVDEDDEQQSPYCLEVYTGDPTLLTEMDTLSSQLRKLKKERYIAQRFLAGLAIFEPPPKILAKILGDGLYRICHNAFLNMILPPDNYHVPYPNINWPVSEPEALKTFVNEQQSIIIAMQERIMLNMITL